MNALALLNNFEREFARPFFRSPTYAAWAHDLPENRTHQFSSELAYDNEKTTWVLTIELAGVSKDQVKIDTADSLLNISGEKTKGLNKGKFEVHYSLPEGIDEEKIEACFEDGILTVNMPQLAKKAAKEITIK